MRDHWKTLCEGTGLEFWGYSLSVGNLKIMVDFWITGVKDCEDSGFNLYVQDFWVRRFKEFLNGYNDQSPSFRFP